jgi:hypothetical protein
MLIKYKIYTLQVSIQIATCNKKGKRYMAYLRGSDLTSTTATPTIKGLFANQMRLIYQINQLDAC